MLVAFGFLVGRRAAFTGAVLFRHVNESERQEGLLERYGGLSS